MVEFNIEFILRTPREISFLIISDWNVRRFRSDILLDVWTPLDRIGIVHWMKLLEFVSTWMMVSIRFFVDIIEKIGKESFVWSKRYEKPSSFFFNGDRYYFRSVPVFVLVRTIVRKEFCYGQVSSCERSECWWLKNDAKNVIQKSSFQRVNSWI